MIRFIFFMLLLQTFLLVSCKNESNKCADDGKQLAEYYKLCNGANKHLLSSSIFKTKDNNPKDAYFAEVVGNRFISANITVLDANFSLDSSYQINSRDSFAFSYKPKMTQPLFTYLHEGNIFTVQQSFLGINTLSEEEQPNILLFQTASMIKNKVVIASSFFKIPVSNPHDFFSPLPAAQNSMQAVDFVNRLNGKSLIENDDLKKIVIKNLL